MKAPILAGLTNSTGWAANAQNAVPNDQYLMGPTGWNCAELVSAVDTGPEPDRGQVAGWNLGFWPAATVYENSAFNDKIENTGGRKIFDLTVNLCRDNPDTMVAMLSRTLLQNTRNTN